jgi:excisionase family DNA binding protein
MTYISRHPTLGPHEVAAVLGVVPGKIQKMVFQGHLKGVLLGSQRRFTISEVRRAIGERTAVAFPAEF